MSELKSLMENLYEHKDNNANGEILIRIVSNREFFKITTFPTGKCLSEIVSNGKFSTQVHFQLENYE